MIREISPRPTFHAPLSTPHACFSKDFYESGSKFAGLRRAYPKDMRKYGFTPNRMSLFFVITSPFWEEI